jgi:hypothetical protein
MVHNLKEALSRVVWLGGATDSGKTTAAEKLAKRHGWRTYHYDKYDRPHHEMLARNPDVHLPFIDNTLDERWVKPTPEDLLKWSLRSFQLRLPLVVEDLLALSPKQVIIAEGFGLLPELIAPFLSHQHQAIWFVPTKAFKQASFGRRGKPSFAAKTSDPEKARMNLFNRDALLADFIRVQVMEHSYQLHEVDGSLSYEETTNLLDAHFSLYLTREAMISSGRVQKDSG